MPTPVLAAHFTESHAAHYAYDHPRKGHDLEHWTVEHPNMLTRAQLDDLGLPADAAFHSGFFTSGVQTWHYTAKRPLSSGTCSRCAS